MKKNIVLLFCLFFACSCFASTVTVENLRTEYMHNPVGIDAKNPRFSWELNSGIHDVTQSTYEIVLSTDEAGKDVVWDSGKIKSDKSININYTGNQLNASTRYYWHVDIATNKGKAKSQTAFFETGLMDSGWSNARWIKLPPVINNVHFKVEMDMILVKDNIGIIFSAKNKNNMYVWQFNTHAYDQPILRRLIYAKGGFKYSDVMLGKYFTKTDLIGKKVHVKIEAENNTIKTYIDNTLIDTYVDQSVITNPQQDIYSGGGYHLPNAAEDRDSNKTHQLINGYIGFRAYKGNNTDEIAYFDNIVVTTYIKDKNEKETANVTFSDDFEKKTTAFAGTKTIKKDGSQMLEISSNGDDYRVLQVDLSKNIDSDINNNEGTPMFRKTFEATKQIESAKIYSSALGIYDLFVNGQRVGHLKQDGTTIYDELKPAWTDYQKTVQYLTYDVTNLVKQGKNAIGAEVTSGWWGGDVAHGEYGTPDLGFIAKLIINYTDGTSQTIVTDPSWLSSTDGAIRMGDIYNGEVYDARKESNWTTTEFDDSKWRKTEINTDFKGNIVTFVGPTIQVRPSLTRHPIATTIYKGSEADGSDFGAVKVLNTVAGFVPVELKKGQIALFDMGQNMVGWIKFSAKGARATMLKIRMGEMLNDAGLKSRGDDAPAGSLYTASLREARATIRYIFKSNETETFNPTFSYFGFRYCEVTADKDVTIEAIEGDVVGSATEELGHIETSSPMINKLYSNILWGQRGNYFGVPTDCPQRNERLGWTGDTQIFSRTATYNADVAGFFDKWMTDMMDSQRADGAYPDVAPHAAVGYGNAGWGDAGVIVPWNMYLAYGDKNTLAYGYSSMGKYMQFLASRAGDGYKYNGSGTAYGDWLPFAETDSRYIAVCYYAYVADLMSKISAVLSTNSNDIYAQNTTKYATLYKNIKAEFQTRYVNADGSLKQKSQTAYLLALKLNLFPNNEAVKNAVKYLVKKIADNDNTLSTGFLGTGILNQTLSEYNADGTAYDLLLQHNCPSWLYCLDQGATTMWERWDAYTIKKGFNDVASFNHYSFGAVAEWMYRYMVGIEVDEANPAFKHIILQPRPDTRTTLPKGQERITWVNGSYHSYYGLIKSAWKLKDDNRITYNASVPANTTATLYLPIVKATDVIYEGGKLAAKSNGIAFVGIKDGKAIYKLKSGDYNFDVRAK